MVKGVSKHIIEINDTGSKYFERVLLFVAPGRDGMSEERLRNEAKNYILKLSEQRSNDSSLRSRINEKNRLRKIMIAAGLTLLTVAAAVIIFNIL